MNQDDTVEEHIARLLQALRERLPIHTHLQTRAGDIPTVTVTAPTDMHDLQRWGHQYGELAEATYSDLYQRLALHTTAIMKLTMDQKITVPVAKLEFLLTAELADVRGLIIAAQNASGLSGLAGLAGRTIVAKLTAVLRQRQIDEAIEQLENRD